MGISFTCNGPEGVFPEFEVGLSYARYYPVALESDGDDKENQSVKFQRSPRGFYLVLRSNACLSKRVKQGQLLPKEDGKRPDACLSIANSDDEIETRPYNYYSQRYN